MKNRGFTLIEVIIGLIILGVLAGIAVPAYQAQIQKSYELEAVRTLGAIRASLARWYSEYGSYTDARCQGLGDSTLDYCPAGLGADVSGQTRHFAYILLPGATTYDVFASLLAIYGGTASDYLQIDETGQIQKFGIFA